MIGARHIRPLEEDAQQVGARRRLFARPRRLVQQGTASGAVSLEGDAQGGLERTGLEAEALIDLGQDLGRQETPGNGALPGRGTLLQIHIGRFGQGHDDAGASVLEQSVRHRDTGHVQHRQMQRRRDRDLGQLGAAIGVDQGKEGRIVGQTLLAHQADAEHRLIDLSGMDLAEYQGLAPIGLVVLFGDLSHDALAGALVVAVEQQTLDPRPADG